MVEIFQQQVVDALKFERFSAPQGEWGALGTPWANIPTFDPPQPDELYPLRTINFDGLYEQPHDNYHGWIGFDMADNSYTAFDPIFLSYHANIDRMLEVWIRAHPAEQYTSQTPLQPFVGALATGVDYATDKKWRYTTLGQMAQDSRVLGYDYGKPVAKQFGEESIKNTANSSDGVTPSDPQVSAASTVGGTVTNNAAKDAAIDNGPWVAFDGVRCTQDSYYIDVFLNKPEATIDEVGPDCPNYVGRFSRIGMGIEDDKGRCIRKGVSRLLSARRAVENLNLCASDEASLALVVTHIDSGRTLSEEESSLLPGFDAEVIWGDPRQPIVNVNGKGSCQAN